MTFSPALHHELVTVATMYLPSFNFKNFYMYLLKSDISLVKISWTVLRYSAQMLKNLLFFQLSHFDDVIKSTWRWRHQKFQSQFVKISTHSIPLPSFVFFWLEIAKIGGGQHSPPVFLGWQKPSSNGVNYLNCKHWSISSSSCKLYVVNLLLGEDPRANCH